VRHCWRPPEGTCTHSPPAYGVSGGPGISPSSVANVLGSVSVNLIDAFAICPWTSRRRRRRRRRRRHSVRVRSECRDVRYTAHTHTHSSLKRPPCPTPSHRTHRPLRFTHADPLVQQRVGNTTCVERWRERRERERSCERELNENTVNSVHTLITHQPTDATRKDHTMPRRRTGECAAGWVGGLHVSLSSDCDCEWCLVYCHCLTSQLIVW
jgi:hypothetical protein